MPVSRVRYTFGDLADGGVDAAGTGGGTQGTGTSGAVPSTSCGAGAMPVRARRYPVNKPNATDTVDDGTRNGARRHDISAIPDRMQPMPHRRTAHLTRSCRRRLWLYRPVTETLRPPASITG